MRHALGIILLLSAFACGRSDRDASGTARPDIPRADAVPATAKPDTLPDAVTDAVPLLADAFADSVEQRIAVLDLLDARIDATYLGEMLARGDSSIARWPDREGRAVRVWIAPVDSTRDDAWRRIVGDAFHDWAASDIPVRFLILAERGDADVNVIWIDRFTVERTGITEVTTRGASSWITRATVQLARAQPDGRQVDTTALAAIARHEVGHVLGLDHTIDSTSIMAARIRVPELSEADRRTVRLLYDLLAGRLPSP